MDIFYAGHVEYDIVKHFAASVDIFFLHFSPKKSKKTSLFLQKWLDHLLLMTSHLVTIATDSLQTCVKICFRADMCTANENGRCR